MMVTNLGKTREELIFDLLISLNNGDSGYITSGDEATPRIDIAIAQYDALVKRGVVREIDS